MNFLPSYDRVDPPHHHYQRGEEAYPPPINLSPFSPPPVGPIYEDGPYPRPPSYRNTYDQPPPPSYRSTFDQPPPSRVYNTTHSPYVKYQDYPPPPPPPGSYVNDENNPHFNPHFNPHMPANFNPKYNSNTNNNAPKKINYASDGVGPKLGFSTNKPSYKIHCKAGGERFAVAIRDGKVVLTRPNSSDPTQKWYKDERYSTKVKDAQGHPSFVLVNASTAQAVKHSVVGYPVQLIHYKPDVFDVSIMWTESKELGSGFRTIRTVNNVELVMDAWNADKDHGGIHDGTIVAVYKCWKGDNQNQQWKLIPY